MTSLEALVVRHALQRADVRRYGPHRSQVGDLHLPSHLDGDAPAPVAVLIHGGYWQARYGRRINRPLAVDLASQGWAAWNIEYRRLGRGKGGGWPATFDDAAAAIDHLAALDDSRLDLDRVALIGHSAGGQLALWAGRRPSLPEGAPGSAPRVVARAVVAQAPVANMVRAGAPAAELLGGTVEQVPERYAQADPMQGVPLDVPVLVVHNADDDTVPVARAREYDEAARAAGGDVTLLTPASGGHREPIHPDGHTWVAVLAWLREQGLGPAA